MTAKDNNTFLIVGAHYRPPAKALLEVLAAGVPLTLRPEPSNPFDPNAVMVILRSKDIPQGKPREVLQRLLEPTDAGVPYGVTLEDVLAQEEWHIGYVPRTQAIELAPKLNGADALAELHYNAQGVPQVSL